jgi:DNA (cytosine-5)-methyltransferase 1
VKRRKALDAYSCAGGAGMGYDLAGFDVTGVDKEPMPNYPFEFIQADALEVLADREFLAQFDVIHASPPCQAFTAMGTMPNAREHPDLLTPTRALLEQSGLPWVIENVPHSPIDVRPPDLFGYTGAIMLCGSMFGLRTDEYELRRHRWFEASIPLTQPPCRHTRRLVVGFYGDHARIRTRVEGSRDRGSDILGEQKMALVKALMGIDWMEWTEANQAIPPAYTEFIGTQLLEHVATREAA